MKTKNKLLRSLTNKNTNRRGDWFVEEVAKVIVAVILLFLLGYLAFTLYESITQKSELEQARVHLDNIKNIINDLEEGDYQSYLLSSPRNGLLIPFYKNSPLDSANQRPRACLIFNNCICIYASSSAVCFKLNDEDILDAGDLIGGITFPSIVYINKKEGVITITGKEYGYGSYQSDRGRFYELLDFKKDENSLSVKELAVNLINQGGNNIESNLEDSIILFSENNKLDVLFSIDDLSTKVFYPNTEETSAKQLFLYNTDVSFGNNPAQRLLITGSDEHIYQINFKFKNKD